MDTLRSDWIPAPRTIPRDHMIAAIGDAHGMANHLAALIMAVRGTLEDHGGPAALVHLGDYIDRGPDPLRCLDLAAAGSGLPDVDEIALMGNHDSWLVDLLNGELEDEHAGLWMANGGLKTLAGFGVSPAVLADGVPALAEAVRAALGEKRVSFLKSLQLSEQLGPYLFVHAGINPTRPITQQAPEDLLWIREPFLTQASAHDPDITVVHGHTPKTASVSDHRIGVDTGCFKTGVLSAVILSGNSLRYICAVGDTAKRAWSREALPAAFQVTA
jgi:serine/threonine protein phosphatase 1